MALYWALYCIPCTSPPATHVSSWSEPHGTLARYGLLLGPPIPMHIPALLLSLPSASSCHCCSAGPAALQGAITGASLICTKQVSRALLSLSVCVAMLYTHTVLELLQLYTATCAAPDGVLVKALLFQRSRHNPGCPATLVTRVLPSAVKTSDKLISAAALGLAADSAAVASAGWLLPLPAVLNSHSGPSAAVAAAGSAGSG